MKLIHCICNCNFLKLFSSINVDSIHIGCNILHNEALNLFTFFHLFSLFWFNVCFLQIEIYWLKRTEFIIFIGFLRPLLFDLSFLRSSCLFQKIEKKRHVCPFSHRPFSLKTSFSGRLFNSHNFTHRDK